MTQRDEHALELFSWQGLRAPQEYGPTAPPSVKAPLTASAGLGPISRASTPVGKPQLGKA